MPCFSLSQKRKLNLFSILSLLICESSTPQLFHLFVQFSPYHGTAAVGVVTVEAVVVVVEAVVVVVVVVDPGF